jgi:hypothetical protein
MQPHRGVLTPAVITLKATSGGMHEAGTKVVDVADVPFSSPGSRITSLGISTSPPGR